MSYPQYTNQFETELVIGEKVIKLQIGKFSEQASAAVLATCGETVVHTTVALGRKVNLGYFPLSVEFAEKLYAAGTIKGSRWVKREGRPLDEEILKARLIDRTLRPLFPEGITNEVQVINTVFSYDGENDPDMLGLLASCLALAISEIPFAGPIAGLRVGYRAADQAFIFNPTNSELETSELDLVVSGSGETIVMVEAGAKEVPEAVVIEALVAAQTEFARICTEIDQIVAQIGKPKLELVEPEAPELTALKQKVVTQLRSHHLSLLETMVRQEGTLEPVDYEGLVKTVMAELAVSEAENPLLSESLVASMLRETLKQLGREAILKKGERPDGRKSDEIRPIWCEVDIFPRTHGSAMFKRGATQVVTITTLGSPSLGQHIESIEGQAVRHYMHFYNMPPYASGEAGRFGFPKRREIGHGALAERALLPVIPTQLEFPYAIHVVSEVVSSNGSTSQASVCASTMSLMAAGVPIKRPVAGIAMGLMSEGEQAVVLSDIQGLEDHTGDMDFKVAGTSEGITALQMDIKLSGLSRQILVQALEQARLGRLHILGQMLKAIGENRAEISRYAPKIRQLIIAKEKIGEVIGPGGKVIRGIIEATGATVDVDEDEEKGVGVVTIGSADLEALDQAETMVQNIVRVVEVGDEFDGTVTRVEDYGIFVEYLPGREGLTHVSSISTEYVASASELHQVGDKVHVRIKEIKDDGKISLTMLTPEQEAAQPPRRGGNGGGGGRARTNRSHSDHRRRYFRPHDR